MEGPPRVVYWLRKDLRLHDNVVWTHVARAKALLPVFVFDPLFYRPDARSGLALPRCGAQRVARELEALRDLRDGLGGLASGLSVVYGPPERELPLLCRAMGATQVHCSRDDAWDEMQVERRVREALQHCGATLHVHETMLLVDAAQGDGAPLPLSFSKWRLKSFRPTQVPAPLNAPVALPPLPVFPLEPVPDRAALAAALGLPHLAQPLVPDARTALPALSAGERGALERVEDYFHRRALVHRYDRSRNGLIGEHYSTKFSPWLALGALSPRLVWREIDRVDGHVKKSAACEALRLELLWRDYFHLLGRQCGASVFWWRSLRGQRPAPPVPDAAAFERWCRGETGNAFVDACMRELRATGFLSNRGRQNAASYLIFDLKQ